MSVVFKPILLLSLPNKTRAFLPPPRFLHHLLPLPAYVARLQLCAARRDLPGAQELHARLLRAGLHISPFAVSALSSLYSKLGRPLDALAAFLCCPAPNLFAWNAAIAALASNGLPADALRLFRCLRSDSGVLPDEFSYPCALKASADLGEAEEVRKLHATLLKCSYDVELFTASALVHAYLKTGFLDEAERVFVHLPARDVVLWNAMVNGFAQLGQFARSLDYFRCMVNEGIVPSKFTVTGILSVFTARVDLRNGRRMHAFLLKMGYHSEIAVSNSLIDLYGKCHVLEEAVEIFESMSERDVFSWNSIICAYQYSAEYSATLQLFRRMRSAEMVADAVTVAAVLPACSQMAALRLGREIHGYMVTSGMMRVTDDVFVYNALTDMYAKCGALEEARLVFDRMLARDVASWNIMIDAYGTHGQGREALNLFDKMVVARVAPDEVTFVSVLSACSHSGLLDEGRDLLNRMEANFGVPPGIEHYTCVSDMLGRAGLLNEARRVAEAAGAAGAGAWKAYLASCRAHGDADHASEAAEKVVEMEPLGSGSYVLLASTFGSAGRYSELAEVRGEMRRQGVRKAPGCSWVEVAGIGVQAFVAGDKNHPNTEDIYTTLHVLMRGMRDEWDHESEMTVANA